MKNENLDYLLLFDKDSIIALFITHQYPLIISSAIRLLINEHKILF